jgi:phytoene dehydrogenase-like protein
MANYDAIIIGGGHNGLVTAAYLGRAGKKVLVLERRRLVGGCSVTEEIWPGYRVSTAAYLSSLLQDRIVQDLDLEHWGYRVDPKDPSFFSPFPDGRYLFFWGDEQKTLAEIAKFSRRDAETFPKYEAHLEQIARFVESLLLTTPPNFPPSRPGDFLEYLKIAARLHKLSRRETVGLVKIFTQSAADLLDE